MTDNEKAQMVDAKRARLAIRIQRMCDTIGLDRLTMQDRDNLVDWLDLVTQEEGIADVDLRVVVRLYNRGVIARNRQEQRAGK